MFSTIPVYTFIKNILPMFVGVCLFYVWSAYSWHENIYNIKWDICGVKSVHSWKRKYLLWIDYIDKSGLRLRHVDVFFLTVSLIPQYPIYSTELFTSLKCLATATHNSKRQLFAGSDWTNVSLPATVTWCGNENDVYQRQRLSMNIHPLEAKAQ